MGTEWTPITGYAAGDVAMCGNRNIFAVGNDGSVKLRGGVDTDTSKVTPSFEKPMGL